MSQTLNLGGEPQSPPSLPLPGLPLPRALVALVSVRLLCGDAAHKTASSAAASGPHAVLLSPLRSVREFF